MDAIWQVPELARGSWSFFWYMVSFGTHLVALWLGTVTWMVRTGQALGRTLMSAMQGPTSPSLILSANIVVGFPATLRRVFPLTHSMRRNMTAASRHPRAIAPVKY